jgi:hypothetical protein
MQPRMPRWTTNAYVQKPVDVYQFMHVIKSIDEFFVSIVRLPSR